MRLRDALRAMWLIVKHRPLLTCPLCKGRGGEVSGYYEPEWSECDCEPHWDQLEDAGMTWCVGRLPVWWWVRVKVSMSRGLCFMGIPRVRDVLRCAVGWHNWHKEESMGAGSYLCVVCFKSGRQRGRRIVAKDMTISDWRKSEKENQQARI